MKRAPTVVVQEPNSEFNTPSSSSPFCGSIKHFKIHWANSPTPQEGKDLVQCPVARMKSLNSLFSAVFLDLPRCWRGESLLWSNRVFRCVLVYKRSTICCRRECSTDRACRRQPIVQPLVWCDFTGPLPTAN